MPGNSYVNVNTKKLTPGKLDFEDLKIPGFPLLNFNGWTGVLCLGITFFYLFVQTY